MDDASNDGTRRLKSFGAKKATKKARAFSFPNDRTKEVFLFDDGSNRGTRSVVTPRCGLCCAAFAGFGNVDDGRDGSGIALGDDGDGAASIVAETRAQRRAVDGDVSC